MRVLVTGVAGKMGRLVARLLYDRGHEVSGLDTRPWIDAPDGLRVVQADVRKRPAEELFRQARPEALVHMATVTHLTHKSEERYRINLGGTQALFRHASTHGVSRVIFVGRHTYYGAAPDAPLYHTEDEPPLSVYSFAELADLVAADLYAGSALWRMPSIDTAVLRICYTLGPLAHGTLAAYLRGPRVPTVLGFDPLFQFMHEQDAAAAICAALESRIRGVYNVAGPPPVPLGQLIRATGRLGVSIPEPLFRWALGRFGLPNLPRGAVDHLKYPLVVDDRAFRTATGFTHAFDETQTIEAFRTRET